MKTVLSIEGGGIRGVVPAAVLQHMEQALGMPLYKAFDYVAGTSTGGIIAAAIGSGMTGSQIVELYMQKSSAIFARSPWQAIKTLGGLTGPKYTADGFEVVLKQAPLSMYYGAMKTRVMIPAYEITMRKPTWFKSWVQPRTSLLTCDVVRATSAAPTFFPPKQIFDKTYIDGGLFCNQPALMAVLEVESTSNIDDEILVVSIGTGDDETPFDAKAVQNWGALQWVQPVTGTIIDAVADLVDDQLRQLLKSGHYLYLNSKPGQLLPEFTNIDDTSTKTLNFLYNLGTEIYQDNKQAISDMCARIVAGR